MVNYSDLPKVFVLNQFVAANANVIFLTEDACNEFLQLHPGQGYTYNIVYFTDELARDGFIAAERANGITIIEKPQVDQDVSKQGPVMKYSFIGFLVFLLLAFLLPVHEIFFGIFLFLSGVCAGMSLLMYLLTDCVYYPW